MSRSLVSVAAATLLFAFPLVAAADTYTIDPSHTSAGFGVVHLGLSHVHGTIPVKSASAEIPAGSTIPTAVTADLNIAGINTNDDRRDADLKGKDWFDVANNPVMTFKSTKITKGGDPASFTIVGELTMHGVTKPLTLDAHVEGAAPDARGNPRIAYSAVGKIDRRAWNVNFQGATPGGNLIVGNEIDLALEIEAVKPKVPTK